MPISIRISKQLRETIDELAKREHRSRGGFIIHAVLTYISDKYNIENIENDHQD